ncbi:hypothetical protein BD626DRAFT_573624 [Schizophyllum amplum]|uniref:Uncharacterized protein n=1 Tax=Schizophyllum amplum TaxID=97359 RepID=A0A550C0T0_9AGAR|nr:hypothetical protein BD626DRAFT_573624 [Auriculariopsis ampla]
MASTTAHDAVPALTAIGPDQRTDSEQTVDSPFASGLNTPADVNGQENPFDYAHKKLFAEDNARYGGLNNTGEQDDDEAAAKKAQRETHEKTGGRVQLLDDGVHATPRAPMPSLNEAALRALHMERAESNLTGSPDMNSPLLAEERPTIYSMPNASISPALPAEAMQATDPTQAAANTAATTDMSVISSTTAVYAGDDEIDNDAFADPFSDVHEYVEEGDSILDGADTNVDNILADSILGAAGANLGAASANYDNILADSILGDFTTQKSVDSTVDDTDDPFIASVNAGAAFSLPAVDSLPAADSRATLPDMDSLDFISSLGVVAPASSLADMTAVAESESAFIHAGRVGDGEKASIVEGTANVPHPVVAENVLDADRSFDADRSLDINVSPNANVSFDADHSFNYDDYDYAMDYDATPLPASADWVALSALSTGDIQTFMHHLPALARYIALGMLKALIFLPWCVAVGGVIVLRPEWLEVVAFGAPEGGDRADVAVKEDVGGDRTAEDDDALAARALDDADAPDNMGALANAGALASTAALADAGAVDAVFSEAVEGEGAADEEGEASFWSCESVAGSRMPSEGPSVPPTGSTSMHSAGLDAPLPFGLETLTNLALPINVALRTQLGLRTHLGLYPYVPRGIHRLAHWAQFAVPHVAIFAAFLAWVVYMDALVGAVVLGGAGAGAVIGGVGVGGVHGQFANGRRSGSAGRGEGAARGEGAGRGGAANVGDDDSNVQEDNATDDEQASLPAGLDDGKPRVGMDDRETVRVVMGAYLTGGSLPALKRVADGGFVWA